MLLVIVAVIIITLIVFVEYAKTNTALDHQEKIYPFDKGTLVPSAIPIKISDMQPNSVIYFMYPPGLSPLGNDNHYQKFMLIRLPLLMGGSNNDISSFRAYSAVDLASHCLLGYWPNEGRQKIEDPCTSPSYRAIDGISEYWPNTNMIRAPSTGALPMLDLSSDSEGYIYVIPPTFTAEKNGVVGYGRDVTREEFDNGSNMLEKFAKVKEQIMSSFHLPKSFGEYELSGIQDREGFRVARYVKHDSENTVDISYMFCNCTKTYRDFLATEGKNYYSDFWKVGDVDIYATPGKVNVVNNTSTLYDFKFYHDGFRVQIVTDMSFEEGIKPILENYFQGYSINDVKKIDT